MQVLVAILLSASLLLASGSYQPSQTDGADGSRLIQLIQMLVAQAGTVQKSATTTERTTVHSAPSSLAKSEGQLAAGTQVTIIRSETVLNVRWHYVQAGSLKGWVPESSLSLAGSVSDLPANVATVRSSANI